MLLLRFLFFFVLSLYKIGSIKDINKVKYFTKIFGLILLLSLVLNVFLTHRLTKLYDVLIDKCPHVFEMVQDRTEEIEELQEIIEEQNKEKE